MSLRLQEKSEYINKICLDYQENLNNFVEELMNIRILSERRTKKFLVYKIDTE